MIWAEDSCLSLSCSVPSRGSDQARRCQARSIRCKLQRKGSIFGLSEYLQVPSIEFCFFIGRVTHACRFNTRHLLTEINFEKCIFNTRWKRNFARMCGYGMACDSQNFFVCSASDCLTGPGCAHQAGFHSSPQILLQRLLRSHGVQLLAQLFHLQFMRI